MKIGPVRILLLILAALAFGWLGAYGANHWSGRAAPDQGLHGFVHTELELSPEQDGALDMLEKNFLIRRQSLEFSLRAANADLASAMDDEHAYGPKVNAAIETVHDRMGKLQKATIEHVFAMRRLLTPQQQQAFDARVSSALTANPE